MTPLVSPVLDSVKYHPWSRLVLTVLSAKNKVEFINGVIPCPPESDPSFSSWICCNNIVVSWLVHSVSVPIPKNIIWMDKALDIWNDLKACYSQYDLSRISDLQMKVSFLNQGDLSKLRVIWDELNNFKPDPQEQQLNNSALIANVKSSNPTTYTNVVTCSFCGKLGHNESVCFKKNNFPNQEGKGPRFCSNNRRVCTYCNKIGHIVDVCYKKHGYPPRDKSQYENPLKPTISLLKRTTLIFVKNVNISNDQAQVNQVGSISVDLQDQYSLSHNPRTKDKIGTTDAIADLYVFNKMERKILSCATKLRNI
ncbi:uncharacterized protein [Phaseolus vulgaris]|uniref:uncharacterized protein n=1 Tax=Phaseolus vulgaris TaxID=3885 RepID=UPI0035CC43E6